MKNDVMGKGRVAGRRCRSRLYALARSPLPVLTTGMWVGDSNEPLEIIVIPKNSTLVEVESIIARIADARGGSKTRHLLVLGVEHLPAILRASKASQDERFRSDSHFVCQQMAEEQHGDLIIKCERVMKILGDLGRSWEILGDRLARSFHPKMSSGFANGPLLYKELKRIDGFPLNETVSRG